MNRFVKFTAGFASAALVMGFAGCGGDTSWTYRSANAEVTSGMYIGLSIDALQTAYSQEGVDSQSSIFSQEIEGYDGLTWVVNRTEQLAKQYLAIEEKFQELGLSFTEEEEAEINSYATAYWDYVSSIYEDEGCGQTSFTKLVFNTEKQQKIFEALYGPGGEREVSEDELRTYYEKDYVKTVYFSVSLIDENREMLEDDELEAQKQEAEKLLQRIQDGEAIEEVKAAYNAETGEDTATDAADTSEYIYTDSGYPDKLKTALFDAEDNAVGLVEDANYIYIWQKLPLDDAGFEQNKSSILSRLKGEEFTELLAEWGSELAVTENEPGIKKHNPKNLE